MREMLFLCATILGYLLIGHVFGAPSRLSRALHICEADRNHSGQKGPYGDQISIYDGFLDRSCIYDLSYRHILTETLIYNDLNGNAHASMGTWICYDPCKLDHP